MPTSSRQMNEKPKRGDVGIAPYNGQGEFMEKKNKNSPARLRANRKYFSAHYRRLSVSVRNEDFDLCMKQIEKFRLQYKLVFFVKECKSIVPKIKN
ncbi:MAG: hypothetical protein L6V93_16800 [Clostridiales bacterium]|nr:MAG: hypothetical protein L6V93_16800 [Clostridiales bacterium]